MTRQDTNSSLTPEYNGRPSALPVALLIVSSFLLSMGVMASSQIAILRFSHWGVPAYLGVGLGHWIVSTLVLSFAAAYFTNQLDEERQTHPYVLSARGGLLAIAVFALLNVGDSWPSVLVPIGAHTISCLAIRDRARSDHESNPESGKTETTQQATGSEPNSIAETPQPQSNQSEPNQQPRHSHREPPQRSASTSKDESEGRDQEYQWKLNTGVSMDDVGGMDDIKDRLRQDVIQPLRTDDQRLEALGLSPSNVLLHGPPGTGKTFLAKAVANEASLPFVRISGGDVTSKWINESSTKIKNLFDEASSVAEDNGGAIIFLDELDSLVSARSGQMHEENRKVVNEFLNGLQETPRNVVILGATNRYEDLDSAAIRRGRFDRHIEVGMPDKSARASIIQAQLRNRRNEIRVDTVQMIAERTSGWSAADLAGLVEDAAKNAAYERHSKVIEVDDIKAVLLD